MKQGGTKFYAALAVAISVKRRQVAWVLLPLLGAGFAGTVAGCGGGMSVTSPAALGRAVFTVQWPGSTSSRLIPSGANSIKVSITSADGIRTLGQATLARPTGGGQTSATFDNLPVGPAAATATAYPTTDGTGTAQAQAGMNVTVVGNQTTPLTLTMASTIDHIDVTPANPTLSIGQKVTLTATPRDATGSIVLTPPSNLRWASSSGAASIDGSGAVTAVSAGSPIVTVTEQESGKSGSTLVTVSGAPTYLINNKPYVTSGPTETLTATFTTAEGGASAATYTGYVLVHVTGVGQSYSSVYNDAFYLYTDPFPTPVNGHDGGFYQLTFSTSPLQIPDLPNNATHSLIGTLPPYSATHDYTLILNSNLTAPGKLHFGVSDGGYSDNTGAYTIKVTQLVPAP